MSRSVHKSAVAAPTSATRRDRRTVARAGLIWTLVAAMATPATAALPAPAKQVAVPAPLLSRVPADSVFYLSWAGTSAEGYDGSKLKKLLTNAAMVDLTNKQVPSMLSSVVSPTAAEVFSKVLDNLKAAYNRPCVVFVQPPSPGGTGEPTLTAIIDGGTEADALQKQFGEALKQADGLPPSTTVLRDGNLLMLLTGQTIAPPVLPASQGLSGKPTFQSAMATVGGTGQVNVYLDIAKLLSLAKTAEPKSTAVLSKLGLDSVQSFSYTAGFEQSGEWVSTAFFAAPSPRTGIIGVLADQKPPAESLLKQVPAGAAWMTQYTLNVPALIDAVVDAVETVQPGAREQLPRVWGMATAATGVQIRENLLEAVSPTWMIFDTGATPGQTVAINRSKDAAKAHQSIDLLVRAGQRFALMAGSGKPPGSTPRIELSFKDVGGVRITTMQVKLPEGQAMPPQLGALGAVALSYAVSGDLLAIGADPDAVASALTVPAKDITTTPAYQALVARLNTPESRLTGLINLPRTVASARAASEVALTQLGQVLPNVDLAAINKTLFDAVEPLMAPAGEARWVDAAGLHLRSVGPFPAAELFGGSGGSAAALGGAALGVSILLPSLNRARETANRVKSASNLRQIGQAIQLHANENRGKYPETLGQLLITQDISVDVFLSPRTNTKVPPALQGPDVSKQELAEWANTSGDVEYIGADLNTSAHPDIVVAHERLNRGLTDGVNVLFGDGRVEFMTLRELPELMKASDELRKGK